MAEAAKAWLLSKLRRGSSPRIETLKVKNSVNSKTSDRIANDFRQITAFTSHPALDLKNSPPYLPGIIMEMHEIIHMVFKKQQLAELKTNEYVNVFVATLLFHCARLLRLFKGAKPEHMEDESSPFRRELNKHSLIFSHMLAELKAICPEGVYTSEFKLIKIEAREFWQKAFDKRLIVPWSEFIKQFSQVHPLAGVEETSALKTSIDFLENDHVSWFEFDIFTRLFQPWQQLLNNWNAIAVTHPGYLAYRTYDEVEAILTKWLEKPGSYVFRLSCTKLGQWAIGFVTEDNKIVQTITQNKSLYQTLIDGMEDGTFLYPNGEDVNPDLRKRVTVSPEQHIKVTKEQFEMYCHIDTTFELCKICDTQTKSVRLDPCGHLLCNACLDHWMDTVGKARQFQEAPCPFCREPIVSTESIVIEPFHASETEEESQSEDPDTTSISASFSASSKGSRGGKASSVSSEASTFASSASSTLSGRLPRLSAILNATSLSPSTQSQSKKTSTSTLSPVTVTTTSSSAKQKTPIEKSNSNVSRASTIRAPTPDSSADRRSPTASLLFPASATVLPTRPNPYASINSSNDHLDSRSPDLSDSHSPGIGCDDVAKPVLTVSPAVPSKTPSDPEAAGQPGSRVVPARSASFHAEVMSSYV